MFLQRRPRILRANAAIRNMVAETVLTPNDFIVPLFIDEGENVQMEIASMPDYYRRSIDLTGERGKRIVGSRDKERVTFYQMQRRFKGQHRQGSMEP
jgi:porphobilinogen synthase